MKLISFLLFFALLQSFAQQSSITGKVTSFQGDPIPGVTVVIKGTTNGTITDLDGNYEITGTNQGDVLQFSFIGMTTVDMTVSTSSVIDVTLEADISELEEIVVVGYGTVKKKDLTGSVGIMDEETLTERSVNNPMEAMQGQVAGVTISSSTGRLGDPYKINIRGNTSLENEGQKTGGADVGGVTQPLYIIDGVVADGIDFLNPSDIARIDILKDASSTAIYGSRGSNGVVIVSTKSGTNAKPGINVSFDTYYGIKKAKRMPDFMEGAEWFEFHKLAYTDQDILNMTSGAHDTAYINIKEAYPAPNGQNGALLSAAAANRTTDWADLVLQDGMMSNNYLSISGSGENTFYNLGAGVQSETGLIQNEALDKYSLKAGFDSKINDWFRVGSNVTYARSEIEQGSDRAMENAFRLSPLFSPYEVDGVTLCKQPGKLTDENGYPLVNKTSTWNPLLEIPNASDLTIRNNLITSTYLQVKFTNWVSFKSTFSTGYDSRNRGQSWGVGTQAAYDNRNSEDVPMPLGSQTKTTFSSYTWDNQLNFDYTTSDGKHEFKALVLQSIYAQTSESNYQYAKQLPFETSFYNLSSGPQSTYLLKPSGDDDENQPYWRKETLSSFAVRLNYGFAGKYLVTLTNRWDGSSVLSEGNKWDFFPSAAVAWRVSEESFMKTQDVMSRFKIRASLGYTGNNAVDPYSSSNILDKQYFYSFNDENAYGWGSSSLPNNMLTWERTRELNFGIDYGFINNRINGAVDIYSRLTEAKIMTERLPLETGFNDIKANVGSVSNKGVELLLNTINVKRDKISWETSFIFSKNVNKIESIHNQSENDDIGNNLFIGESVNSIYNYEFDGVVQANEVDNPLYADADLLEGAAKIVDANGDGALTTNDDRKVLGSSDPSWTGTFNSRLTAYNFDFSFSILTFQGVLVNSPFHRNFIDLNDRGRQKLDVNYYVPENNLGLVPNASNDYPRPRREGTFWRNGHLGQIQDASYTKIKNIAVGYSLPSSLLEKIRVKSLRIYFNVIDPFVFTKYTGFDPEWATASLKNGRVGYTTYQVGANLKF